MTEKDENEQEIALEDFKLNPISSAQPIKPHFLIDENDEDLLSLESATETLENADLKAAIEEPPIEQEESEDPIFKELSAPVLPELDKENRARLQMQSPNRIYFYWSFKENPFKILSRVFGSQTNYQLVARLLNQTNSREELFPIDADGAAWFNVDAGSSYQVEVGFYAVNRPFVRVLFSNTLQTPRKSPSPRQDYSEYFAVSADQFAKVLNVSGYSQDAYEVALAGDDIEAADRATETAFGQIFDAPETDFKTNQASEMRFVLLALASGYTLEDLRPHISPSLFAFLQNHVESLNSEKALAALQENFGVGNEEFDDEAEESFGAAVFGLSSVNFPRNLKRRTRLPKFSPLSSLR